MTIGTHESWYSRTTRDLPLVAFTAIATAFFTAFFTYFATIQVENARVRSADIVKLTDDFQSKFSSVISDLQKFTTNSINQQKVSDQDRIPVDNSILLMQLTLSPATNKWPQDIIDKPNAFFKDLAKLEKEVRSASTFTELEPLNDTVRQLVIDDMEITRAMQQKAQISYWPFN